MPNERDGISIFSSTLWMYIISVVLACLGVIGFAPRSNAQTSLLKYMMISPTVPLTQKIPSGTDI
jgi:hypothetical protein